MFIQTASRPTVPAACVKFSLVCVCVCVCVQGVSSLSWLSGAGALAQWAGVRRYGRSDKKIVDIFVDVVKIARSGFVDSFYNRRSGQL